MSVFSYLKPVVVLSLMCVGWNSFGADEEKSAPKKRIPSLSEYMASNGKEVVTRDEWGATCKLNDKDSCVEADQVDRADGAKKCVKTRLIVQHTVGYKDDAKSTARYVEKSHSKWAAPGYHYGIDGNQVFLMRPTFWQPSCISGENKNCVAVGLFGCFTKKDSEASARELTPEKKGEFIDTLASLAAYHIFVLLKK